MNKLMLSAVAIAALAYAPRAEAGDCKCLSVAADVSGALQAEVAKADGLYARGELKAALAIYARAHAEAKAPALLYAQAMTQLRLGASADAKAMFEAYLKSPGTLAYRDHAEAGLRDLGAGVAGVVGAGGMIGDRVGRAVDVDGAGQVTGTVGGVAGEVRGRLGAKAKPPKVAKGAAIVLGVVAIAAIGAVGIHSIAAGLKDDVSLDAKFDLGLGLTGLSVGITAIYLYGLTAATGTAGSLKCATLPAGRPIVAPIALPGGGGLATAMTF